MKDYPEGNIHIVCADPGHPAKHEKVSITIEWMTA